MQIDLSKMRGQNRLVAVLMAVGFYCVAEWPF
jgi:hypothetical protein